ncbi:hypothetical protein NQ176_g87 [Zarea fungicola]|uniref:Uncharacterized protein n=1 Tax=Zarea fungicola TaxID=93591 RepID=A0ACC1NZA7_9HYPO|nr:hypothetical protein NQ176_g87 [Lecanicillium fungicola]
MLGNPTSNAYRTTSVIWKWVAERKDVSIGENRRYNNLTLHEVLSLTSKSVMLPFSKNSEASQTKAETEYGLKLYVSEETMWESLTGHGIDYKRIPRSEWTLLQGIASTAARGILQGDLGRLVGQDKRSVPKRTSCLVEKGYITKRTTLVRGTKTSKLWLKFLAPSMPEESGDSGDVEIDITLSRQYLVDDLEPVPWHTRWTGDSIDYKVLATTILATCKEWKVMRLQDLKSKLGILGMSWQMKVVSKICRFLNARGMIQYVAAKLSHRIFKDCVRFNRDMNARDWSIFLATGKRAAKSSKVFMQENAEEESNILGLSRSETGSSRCPVWTIYMPMASLVAICIQESGEDGLTNPQLSAMTLGPSFTRYLAGLTASISSEDIQPENAKHLTINNQRGRPGKSSSLYWYYMTSSIVDHFNTASEPSDKKTKSKAKGNKGENYQFASLTQLRENAFQAMTLSELCCRGLSRQKKKGRPKKITMEDQTVLTNASSQWPIVTADSTPMTERIDNGTVLDAEMEEEQNLKIEIATLEESLEPTENGDFHELAVSEPSASERETSHRGYLRGHGRTYSGGGSLSSKEHISIGRHFKCESCSGTWKNNLGLKYHLEKSQTSCNPSFKPHLMTPTKKRLHFGARSRQTKQMAKPAKETNSNSNDLVIDMRVSRAMSSVEESRRAAIQPVPIRTTSTRRKLGRAFDSPTLTGDITALPGQAELLSAGILFPPRQVDPFTKHARQPTASDRIFEASSDMVSLHSLKEMQTVTSHSSEASSAVVLSASASVTTKINDAFDHRKIKKSARRTAMDLIIALLHEHGGALPAGQALEALVGMAWTAQLPNEDVPSGAMIRSAMQQMIRAKTVVDQWHAFRALDGKIGKCQIITTPSVPVFAPEARALVERIKQLYPATILPEQLPQTPRLNQRNSKFKMVQESYLETVNRSDNNVGGRGRRSLAAGVAVLSAPVYAAQLATKRLGDDGEAATNPTNKRRRAAEGTTDGVDESVSHQFWPVMDQPPPLDTTEQPPSFNCAAFTLDVLFQNLNRNGNGVCESQMPLWPHSGGLSSFERLTSAMHQQGWLPRSNWFSWASTYRSSLESPTFTSLRTSECDFFLDKLRLCLAIELDTEGGIPLPIKAHNTFVNFIGGDNGRHLNIQDIQWSKPDRRQSINLMPAITAKDNAFGDLSASGDEFMEPVIVTIQNPPVFGSATTFHTLSIPPPRPVILASRNLTSLSPDENGGILTTPKLEFDSNELVAAFVAVRSLLGGVDKAIDWGLMVDLFPNIGLESLRRFWAKMRKEKASFLFKATQAFQDSILVAIQNDEIPIPDFDQPQEYDWKTLILWTMRHRNQEQLQLPTTRDKFHHDFELEDGNRSIEDWRERFFHPQSSVYSRFEAATLQPGSLTATEVMQVSTSQPTLSTVDIARSWIRSLCCTSETDYTPQDVKDRFSSLSGDTLQQSTAVLKAAIDQLTQERVICKSKRTPLGGRPYRLNEGYTSTLAKLAHRQKYVDAIYFKRDLDIAVRRRNRMQVPYTLSDGAVMALTNLIANDRIRVTATKVPNIPFGFEPGNYESRKYPKSYYHLDLEVKPTASYLLNDTIEALGTSIKLGPPREGQGREIPQWVDFFGKLDEQRWADILGAVCFALSTRGIMSVMGVCDALSPILEVFEARLIIAWGVQTGVFVGEAGHSEIRLGEWWWLVPQQPFT